MYAKAHTTDQLLILRGQSPHITQLTFDKLKAPKMRTEVD